VNNIQQVIDSIRRLPGEWHTAGSVPVEVLHAIGRLGAARRIERSLETGSGKTTLLLSHLSPRHEVFALDGDNRSISAVLQSPLLRTGVVHYTEGPTQQTLPQHVFSGKYQLALLDGPHAYPFPELEYYYIYPHLDTGALLIVDDIQIPTIRRMFEFLAEDEMFEVVEVVWDTAFLVRTRAPTFDPFGDGWWRQRFNERRFPVESLLRKLRRLARQMRVGRGIGSPK
jgi:hypothetical protein